MPAIQVESLVKKYGRITALQGVSLKIEKGEIYGLLGRNGAGKSTLVKILLSLTYPTSGQAKLFDEPVGNPALRRRVGFLPEDHKLPEYHSGRSFLSHIARLYDMPSSGTRARIDQVLEMVALKDRADDRIRGYSKGMRQRLGFAQAILHSPELVILDEPTDGVDPVGRREIRDLILALKEEGKTIFINSHLLHEIELTCDRVAIIEEGKLIREGGVEELTRAENVFEIRISGDATTVLGRLVNLVGWARPTESGLEVKINSPAVIDQVIDALRGAGVGIRGLTEKTQRLEDVFLREVKKKDPA